MSSKYWGGSTIVYYEYDRHLAQAHTSVHEAATARPSTLFDIPEDANSGRRLLRYVLVSGKDRLLDLTRLELPRVMGTEYSKVVETCLTCLDENNDDFGDQSEFEDTDGIVVGARYIEKASSLLLLATLVEDDGQANTGQVILRLSMMNL